MKVIWTSLPIAMTVTAVIFLGVLAIVAYGRTRPVLDQSDGYTAITAAAMDHTLSGTLPISATNVRYVQASVGLGGRLLLYRFNAPLSDLQDHVKAEFAAHWDKPTPKVANNALAPITDPSQYKSGFGISSEWMVPPTSSNGTLYISDDGQVSHRPMIYIDETSHTLYFYMTD